MADIESPRVFISYSWTNQDHMDWVLELAERLVGDGIDTVLDVWDFKEGHDKFAFMERLVTDPSVHKVLAICDKKYAEKANDRSGGVGTETQIISKDVYDKVTQEKFIPILCERDEDNKECLPVFFQNRKYIDFSDEDSFELAYDQLTRLIYGKPERRKPPLGKPPVHLLQEDAPFVKTAGKLNRLKDVVQRGKPHGQALLQEFFDTFIEALEDFRIKDDGSGLFDEVVFKNVESFRPYRDTFIELVFFITGYMDEAESYDKVFAFLEGLIPFQSRPEEMRAWRETDFDNYRFFATEVFLSLIAALVKSKKYEAVSRFMDHEYTYATNQNGSGWEKGNVTRFNQHVVSLDETRPKRLKLNRLSFAADLIGERAHARLPVKDLIQADLLLMVRPAFPFQESVSEWWPRSPSWQFRDGTLELFARASSPNGFTPLSAIFKVKKFPEFVILLNRFFSGKEHLARFEFQSRVSWTQLFNLNELIEVAKGQA